MCVLIAGAENRGYQRAVLLRRELTKLVFVKMELEVVGKMWK